MKDIYEGASEIVAWLGPEGDNGMLVLRKIADVYEHYWKEWDRLGTPEAAFQSMLDNTTWVCGKSKANASSFSNFSKQYQGLQQADRAWSLLGDLVNRT